MFSKLAKTSEEREIEREREGGRVGGERGEAVRREGVSEREIEERNSVREERKGGGGRARGGREGKKGEGKRERERGRGQSQEREKKIERGRENKWEIKSFRLMHIHQDNLSHYCLRKIFVCKLTAHLLRVDHLEVHGHE